MVETAGLNTRTVQRDFWHIHAVHLHKICSAVLCLSCDACYGAAVQHCGQRFLGGIQPFEDGEMPSFAGDQCIF